MCISALPCVQLHPRAVVSGVASTRSSYSSSRCKRTWCSLTDKITAQTAEYLRSLGRAVLRQVSLALLVALLRFLLGRIPLLQRLVRIDNALL